VTTVTERARPQPASGVAPQRGRATRRRAGRVAVGVGIVIALIVCLAPIYWMVTTSFKSQLEVAKVNPTLFPHDATTGNYRELVGHSLPFTSFLVNSVVVSLIAAVIAVFFCTLAGYSLSRGNYRLRGISGHVILATRMLPLVVLIGPLYLVLLKVHLLDTYLGLIIAFTSFSLPFGAWMMKGFIDAVPRDIEEAARVDGYKRMGILLRVIVPMTVPGLFTTGTFVFMDTWNNLLYPLTLMNTLHKQTLPPGLLDSFTGTFKTDWGGMMAAALITTIPLMAAFFAVQRYMVRGLTAGALAGE
jgi:ABC-type glycerol-3-phosphate transport system permease component